MMYVLKYRVIKDPILVGNCWESSNINEISASAANTNDNSPINTNDNSPIYHYWVEETSNAKLSDQSQRSLY